jgi:hypothetical protein
LSFLDQRNLPRPRPPLEPFFAMNRLFDLLKHLEVDEARDIVTFGETFGDFQAMLGDASDEVVL